MQQLGALRFALTRLLSAIPTLFLIIVLAFTMMHAAPGGPFDEERAMPPETAENIERAYHLDESLPQQFKRYFGGLLQGDLGPSYRYPGYSVAERIGGAMMYSLKLGALAILSALIFGIGAGVLAAVRKNSLLDRLVTGLAMTGISIPVFVIAPFFVLVFAVYLGWLPVSWGDSESALRYLLPVTALALPQIAYVTRLTRASMIEVMNSEFIRTARSQGLSTFTIVRRHAMRPAMVPLLSYMGPAVAAVLTGSVVVEQIFGIPGLGQLFVSSALNRDYTLVLGIVIFYATLVIVLNLLVDIAYGFLDPRIRKQ
jgi:oligopeptide transport system permease protein